VNETPFVLPKFSNMLPIVRNSFAFLSLRIVYWSFSWHKLTQLAV